jgi:hypothetical protein
LLLDHESNPVDNAEVVVWTSAAARDPSSEHAWTTSAEVSRAPKGSLAIALVRPGSCVLVARYEGPSAQNFIIHRFSIAPGETKDLGALRPEGKDHSFRLGILDRSAVDITATASPTPAGPDRSTLVQFDLANRASAEDPPVRWTFYRPRGTVITVRGLDVLQEPIELQARVRENALLPPELRIEGPIRPIGKIGRQLRDPVKLNLVVAPARKVEFEFGLPEHVVVLEPGQLVDATNTGAGSWLVSDDAQQVRVAIVDSIGNVRVFRMVTGAGHSFSNTVSLVPGKYELYAFLYHGSFQPTDWLLKSDEIHGTARQTLVIEEMSTGELVHVDLKSGVTIMGKATVKSAFRDPRERRALAATFAALVPPRTLTPLGQDETALIDVPLHANGEFEIRHLPPGQDFAIGLPGLEPQNARPFRVPAEGGFAGEVVID